MYKILSELKSNNLISLVSTLQLLCLNHELEGLLSGWPHFPSVPKLRVEMHARAAGNAFLQCDCFGGL